MSKIILSIIFLITFAYSKEPKVNVSLQLLWLNQFQFAGFYIAKEKGYYYKAGIDIEIKEYKKGVDVVEDVIAGKSDFGVGRSKILVDVANGKDIVGLLAIFQNSPLVLISTNSPIKKLSDLKNKKVMITPDAISSAGIFSMLKAKGLGKDDITIQEHSFILQDLIDGKTDAMACYVSNEPYLLKKLNKSFQIFDPKNYGFDFYGDMLFTSKEFLKNNPKMVQAFYDASKRGWEYAFAHIEESAKIIYEKYNTQNKSLQALINEGEELKELAYVGNKKFGIFDKDKLNQIANIYKLNGFIKSELTVGQFVEDNQIVREHVKIGILAKRGLDETIKRWKPLATYLGYEMPSYNFEVVPLDFDDIEDAISYGSVDFLLVNTMNYVQYEHLYGITRIATLKNRTRELESGVTQFGTVLLTLKENRDIDSIGEIKSKRFGAVSEHSFGGWVLAQKLLKDNNIDKDDIDLQFFNSHDLVIEALLKGEIDAGCVRSDTLENMAGDGKVNIEQFKVVHPNVVKNFPYLLSSDLYPEWPLAKLKHTHESVANDVLSKLLQISHNSSVAIETKVDGWTIPLDYSNIHTILKELRIYPFDKVEVSWSDIYRKYTIIINLVIFSFVLVVLVAIYVEVISLKLNKLVKERTKELQNANEKLLELATIDDLTKIYNRREFLNKLKNYVAISDRNDTPLSILSLDIDHFKVVNDTYGHNVGDDILIMFVDTIKKHLRQSDVFGRLGGEEFNIILQNTDTNGAIVMAQDIKNEVENARHTLKDGTIIQITVSIGVTKYIPKESNDELLKRADIALYSAKNHGRNKVELM